MQGAFDTLNGMFDRVGLQKNVWNTVGMLFCPCRAFGTLLEESYECWMTGESLTYWACQILRLQCQYCEADLVLSLLVSHRQTQHGFGISA